MKNIEKISKINRDTLSGEHYFQSLLEKAFIAQLLSEAELEKIQFDCLSLLAKKTKLYNGCDSSSIRVEKAQSILASIIFTIGVYLKTFQSPDDAVEALQSMGVEAVCAQGRKRIDRLIKQAKTYHASLVKNLLKTKNVFYSATAKDGIEGFFKLYDADFAAQEIHITADYPVFNKTPQLLGIEFIVQYLKQLSYENMFCTLFSAEDIHYLLCGCNEGYENLLLNIYEPVLAAALGCVIAQAPVNTLELTHEMQAFLQRSFEEKAHTQIEHMLAKALLKLAKTLSLSDSLLAYIRQSLPVLSVTIESAIKSKSLEQVFTAAKYPEDSIKLTISYGEKMDDEMYRRVLNEFMSCEHITRKISIMKSKIHSLADLEDLLLDAEPAAQEIDLLLKSLSLAEIAALTKKHSSAYKFNFTQLRDCEKVLCEGLLRVTLSLPEEQQKLLKQAVKSLEIEGTEH